MRGGGMGGQDGKTHERKSPSGTAAGNFVT